MKMNITEFTIAKADSGPYDIAAAKDGNIWFTQYKANQISCINKNGEIKEYEVHTLTQTISLHLHCM